MTKVRITKTTVDALPVGESVWDTDVLGFGVRRQRKGASYVLKTTSVSGRQLFVTIGRHGQPWTPQTARAQALELLTDVRQGHDPAAERRALRQTPTVAELAESYLQEIEATRRPLTAYAYRGLMKNHVVKKFGKMLVCDVTHDDVVSWHAKFGRTPTANRALAVISGLMKMAVRKKHRKDNPCQGVGRVKERPRDRVPTIEELQRIGEALAMLEGTGPVSASCARAIRLCALTGCRQGEIRHLRWEDVDLTAGTFRVRETKNAEPREVALVPLAVELLKPVAAKTGHVCPAARDPKRPLVAKSLFDAWTAVRDAAGSPDLRLHDLRANLATEMARQGASVFLVMKALGHKSMAMSQRYVRRVEDAALAAAGKAGSAVGAALSGRKA